MESQSVKSELETHWVGLDVSKGTFDAAWLSASVAEPSKRLAGLPAEAFARTPAGVEAFAAWLEERLGAEAPESEGGGALRIRCVMEATGRYSTELSVMLLDETPSLAPAIAPPRQTASFIQSLGLRNLTDKLAARGLAVYGRERTPEAYVPPSEAAQALREVCRYRSSLVRQQTMVKNQSGEEVASRFVRQNRKKRLDLLKKDIARAEKEMQRMVKADAEVAKTINLLCTIYGVGFLTAVVVHTEMGDLRRFEKARSLSAFAGLNPSERRSGTSVRGRTRMSKQGNAHIRHALYMAAVTVIRAPSELTRTYERLIAEGKKHKAALGAVMRKLLVLMRAILISGEPYDPAGKSQKVIHNQ